jgi:hypothetical protein
MHEQYDNFEPPRPVWIKHSDGLWYPGHSLRRLSEPNKRYSRFQVAYATSNGLHRLVAMDLFVKSRHPMAEPGKNVPCAQCGSSREDCDRRQQTDWPPFCCPRCWRSPKKYELHAAGRRLTP